MLNLLISNINLSSLPEINSTWSFIIYKSHGKPRNSSRSYRLISTCPIIAKGLDKWVSTLKNEDWNKVKAQTQFMCKSSSHELAILLLTEVTRYSVMSLKKPIFCLYLDKKSAYDVVRSEDVVSAALAASGGPSEADQSLVYIAKRLQNRLTYIEYDKTIMSPIFDTRGLEQGGILSSSEFQLVGNKELSTANDSALGITIGKIHIASDGFQYFYLMTR